MKEFMIGIGVATGITIMVILVQILSTYLKSIMSANKQEALLNQNMVKANAFQAAINVIDKVTTATVSTLEQTVAGDLRQAVKDGKADRQELIDLSTKAYLQILEQVKPEVIECLKENVRDSEGYIKNRIEQAVLEVKQNTPVTFEELELEAAEE